MNATRGSACAEELKIMGHQENYFGSVFHQEMREGVGVIGWIKSPICFVGGFGEGHAGPKL